MGVGGWHTIIYGGDDKEVNLLVRKRLYFRFFSPEFAKLAHLRFPHN